MGIDQKTFPATNLKPYAEPAVSEELRQGQVYFALQFAGRFARTCSTTIVVPWLIVDKSPCHQLPQRTGNAANRN